MQVHQDDLGLADYRRWFPLAAKSTDETKEDIKKKFLALQYHLEEKSDFVRGAEFAELYINLFPLDSDGFYYNAKNLESAGKTDLAIQQISKGSR